MHRFRSRVSPFKYFLNDKLMIPHFLQTCYWFINTLLSNDFVLNKKCLHLESIQRQKNAATLKMPNLINDWKQRLTSNSAALHTVEVFELLCFWVLEQCRLCTGHELLFSEKCAASFLPSRHKGGIFHIEKYADSRSSSRSNCYFIFLARKVISVTPSWAEGEWGENQMKYFCEKKKINQDLIKKKRLKLK